MVARGSRPPGLHVLAVGQGRRAGHVASTRRRSSACAASRWRCARTCAGKGVGVSVRPSRASSATPACSPTRARSCPPYVGTKLARATSRDAVVKAIEHNRAELDVAPLPLRAGAHLAALAPGRSATSSAGSAPAPPPAQFDRRPAPTSASRRTPVAAPAVGPPSPSRPSKQAPAVRPPAGARRRRHRWTPRRRRWRFARTG